MTRTPEEILAVLDQAQESIVYQYAGEFDLRSLMWEIINDIRSSYELEMSSQEVQGMYYVINAVNDYIANHYGDD